MMMARRKRQGLSERQIRILVMLENYLEKYGYPPAIREVCEQTKIRSTSVVNYYLNQLEDMGYIERDGHVSRGIRLLKPVSEASSPVAKAGVAIRQAAQDFEQAVTELLHIPILGRIQAGRPIPVPSTADFSLYDPESMVDVASSLLPSSDKGANLFAMEVQGDSMIDAMVYDGDIVILKPTPITEVRNGEMVAVWLTDREETTLKYIYIEKGYIRLQPANPTYKPIFVEDPKTVEVQGKVVLVIRQVKGLVA